MAHPPAVAVAIQQAKGECGAAEDIGVERVGAECLGQFRGDAARVLRQGIPDAELPGDPSEMSHVVPGHQVQLVHLVGELGEFGALPSVTIASLATNELLCRGADQATVLGRDPR